MDNKIKDTKDSKALYIGSAIPCFCSECRWSGDFSETTKELVRGFNNKITTKIPVCPDCSYDIRIQE